MFLCVSSQRAFNYLWNELQKDRPELLSVLEGILIHAVSQLKDCIRERDSLEQALRRCCPPPGSPPHPPDDTAEFCLYVHSSVFSVFCSRRESEHDKMVRSIYEETESQIREEREKRSTQVQIRLIFHGFWHQPTTCHLYSIWIIHCKN